MPHASTRQGRVTFNWIGPALLRGSACYGIPTPDSVLLAPYQLVPLPVNNLRPRPFNWHESPGSDEAHLRLAENSARVVREGSRAQWWRHLAEIYGPAAISCNNTNRWQIGLLVIVFESDLSVCGGSGIASGSDSESHLIHHYWRDHSCNQQHE